MAASSNSASQKSSTVAAAGAKPILFGTSKELLQLFTMMKIDQLYKFAKDQNELDALIK